MVQLLSTYAALFLSALISSSTINCGGTAFALAIDARPLASAASLAGGRKSLSLCLEQRGGRISDVVGRGGALLRLSAAKDDDAPPLTSPREEALASMKKCYNTVFAAVAVDAWTRLMPDVRGGWDIMLASRPSSWLDVADALSVFDLLLFGLGLRWVSHLYEKIRDSIAEGISPMSAVTNIMASYRFMYLATGWTLVGLSMRIAYKVFVSSTIAPSAVLALAVGASVYVNTNLFTSEAADMATLNKTDNPAMMNGIKAARNMSFCAISFLLFAVLRFIFWTTVVVPSDLVLPIKIVTVNKFLTPLALAKLLQSLDRRFLDAAMMVTKDSYIEKELKYDVDALRALKEAEKSFYDKVANVLRSNLILDLLRYGIPIIMSVVKGT
jgi:hypothetical protein